MKKYLIGLRGGEKMIKPKPKVKAGQIWIYEVKNPFTPICDEHLVLEVKAGYVKYENITMGWINSMSISMFLTGAHLKK